MNVASIIPLDREIGLIQVHQMTSGRFHAVGMGMEADTIEELVRLCDAVWLTEDDRWEDNSYTIQYAHACGYAD